MLMVALYFHIWCGIQAVFGAGVSVAAARACRNKWNSFTNSSDIQF